MVKTDIRDRIDSNHNGDLSPSEMRQANALLELELREEKAETQKKMAWVAMVSMLIVSIGLFLPFIPDTRVKVLSDLLGLFYVAQAGVVGAYMGVTAWMENNKRSRDSYYNRYSSYSNYSNNDYSDEVEPAAPLPRVQNDK